MICILPELPAFYFKKWLSEVKWYHTHFSQQNLMERVAPCNIIYQSSTYNTSSSSTISGDQYGSCATISQPFSRAQQFTAVVSVHIMVDFSKFVSFNSLPCIGITIIMKMTFVFTTESKCSYHAIIPQTCTQELPTCLIIIICTLVSGGSIGRAVWLVHLFPSTWWLVIHHYMFACVSLHIPKALFSSIILPHPQAYAVFMAVHSLHHPSIRSGTFVFEFRWGRLVIIMGIKQVSATNCCTGETLCCDITAFNWMPQ